MLEATIPPPMRTTSAVCMMCFDDRQANAAATATPISTTTAYQPNTMANAVPRLTLLMQVMPIAVRTRVQMVKMSNDVSRLASAGWAARSTKYPGLVATGFWKVNPSLLTPASSDKIASSDFSVASRTAATIAYQTSMKMKKAYENILVNLTCPCMAFSR